MQNIKEITCGVELNEGQQKMRDILVDDKIRRFLVYSGSRAGKTFEFIRSILLRALMAEDSRHVIIRKHFAQVKKYIWLDTLPTVVNKCFKGLNDYIDKKGGDFFYKLDNGSEIWIGGLDDKERADKILGGEYNTIYFNECSEISYSSVVTALTRLGKKSYKADGSPLVNKAFFDCNPPAKSHWSYKLFFEDKDPEANMVLPDSSIYKKLHIKPQHNLKNLSSDFILTLKNLTGEKRKRFFEGVYQDEIKGALWSQAVINNTRRSDVPELKRILVAVDPAMSKTGDETGIIVVGQGIDDHIYVLEDRSGNYLPYEWANVVAMLYDKYHADGVVGEVNNGGDLVESNITSMRKDINFIEVRASRGKITRAEPVSSWYNKGLIHHVGEFTDLEYQLTTYTGDKSEVSPDRMDALVWGCTVLMEHEPIEDDIILSDEKVRISNI